MSYKCKKMSSKDHTITEININENDIWSGYHKEYTPINNPKPIIFKIVINHSSQIKAKILVNHQDIDFDKELDIKDVYVVYKLSA
jgi:hypothetical protein